MPGFEEYGLRVESVLTAIVEGGNVIVRKKGSRKRRLKVTNRQERLIRAVAENGGEIRFEELKTTFPQNWKGIKTKHPKKYRPILKRLFFRNVSRIAERINDNLAAGYVEASCAQGMLAKTAGKFFGLIYDYQNLNVGFLLFETIEDFLQTVPLSADGKRFVSGSGRSAADGKEIRIEEDSSKAEVAPVVSAGLGPDAPQTGTRTAGDVKGDRMDPEMDPDILQVVLPEGKEPAQETPGMADSDPLDGNPVELFDFEEDILTGSWKFILDEHRIEIRRDIGYLSVDGRLFQADYVKELKQPTEIEGKVVEAIRRCILGMSLAE